MSAGPNTGILIEGCEMLGSISDEKSSSEAGGEYVTARLNARVQPLDRGEYFEDPLADKLEELGLGEVTGGGTQLCDEPAGIAFCDLEIHLKALSDETLDVITQHLTELGAPKGSKLIVEATGREIAFGDAEGLGLFLNGTDLADEVYETSDINHVVEECGRLMSDGGTFKGHWQGSAETALYFYGSSFAAMNAAIADFIAAYPLCQKARVEQIA